MQEQRMVAPAHPREPGAVAEPGGNGVAHDHDGLLLEVSRSAARHRDLQSLLCDLVTLLRRAVPFDRLGVMLHDPARDVMRLHTLVGVRPMVATVMELSPAATPAGVAWLTQQPAMVPSVDRETRFPEV